MVSAVICGLFVKRPDVVIATSPQFFCGWAGVIVSRFRSIPFILEIRDIWPESIVAVGAMSSGRLLRFLEWLEMKLYGSADRIVTVGDGYKRKLVEKTGTQHDKISIIPNAVDMDMFSPRAANAELREQYGLRDGFVCSYIGTIGMASGLDVVLNAARILRKTGRQDIKFLLVGDGAAKDDLQRAAQRDQLDNIVFTGRQDKKRIPEFLALSDACLVHLKKKETFETVMPSKIYEACAMSKPIILGVKGCAAKLVADAGAGICIEPEDAGQLVDAVLSLAKDEPFRRALGEKGRQMVLRDFDCDQFARTYLSLIRDMCE
jgi:glycosyltransferase involved in cell wall biosynthesis